MPGNGFASLLDTPEGRKELEQVLADVAAEPELVERGLAHLRGAADPLGAAVAAMFAVPDRFQENAFARIVDGSRRRGSTPTWSGSPKKRRWAARPCTATSPPGRR